MFKFVCRVERGRAVGVGTEEVAVAKIVGAMFSDVFTDVMTGVKTSCDVATTGETVGNTRVWLKLVVGTDWVEVM